MPTVDPREFLFILAAVLPSLTIHEFAHAWTAYKFGDDTAKSMGRLTLNPIAHIDLFGTIILPLFAHFGWARPVPVNFNVLNRAQILLVAVAGPLSNIFLAILLTLAFHVLPVQRMPTVGDYLFIAICLNIVFAVFNLIPIPPLDGSRIVYAGLKSQQAINIYRYYSRFGIFILIGLIYFGGFSKIINPVINIFLDLFHITWPL